jgi:hypothetical protein
MYSTLRRFLIFSGFLGMLVGCKSVEKYNQQLSALKSPERLKADVDHVQRKLNSSHPVLHWYISKADLDHKFDSLKAAIKAPMNSYDFFLKLAPVVAAVKQGHSYLIPPVKKLSAREAKEVTKIGRTPFSNFSLEMLNGRLFIVKSRSKDTSIKAGTEIVKVNGVFPKSILEKYKPTLTTDGYNQTNINRRLNLNFPNYFYQEYGLADSVLCELHLDGVSRSVYVKRDFAKKVTKKASIKKAEPAKQETAEAKQEKRERGYEEKTKSLSFLEKDSSVAMITIRNFKKGPYKQFYAKSFKRLKSANSKTLILDLRSNGGGRLSDIYELYSYLADSNFHFTKPLAFTSRLSTLKNVNGKLHMLPVGAYLGLRLKRGIDGLYYYSNSESRVGKPKAERFQGKIYILINGGSFSATCILSSHLKGKNDITFVGEETGGAYNGTVAGIMPVVTLPNSKIRFRYGLALVQPTQTSPVDGRGIFPDVEITPTLTDRIKQADTELDWVLQDIKKRRTAISKQ